jgi:hypothetical protein
MSNLVQGLFLLAERSTRWMQNRRILVILQRNLCKIVCHPSIIQKTTDNLFPLSHDTELAIKERVQHPQMLQLKHYAHPVIFPPTIDIRGHSTPTMFKKSTRLIDPNNAALLLCIVRQGTTAAIGTVKVLLPMLQ